MGIVFFEHLKLTLDLVTSFSSHLSCNECEVTPILLHQLDHLADLNLCPLGRLGFGFKLVNGAVLAIKAIFEGDFVDVSGDGGNRGVLAGVVMAVSIVNSHAEDTTGSI